MRGCSRERKELRSSLLLLGLDLSIAECRGCLRSDLLSHKKAEGFPILKCTGQLYCGVKDDLFSSARPIDLGSTSS